MKPTLDSSLLRWLTRGWTWKRAPRTPIAGATLHPSVEERFRLDSVPRQGGEGPYRPEALRIHERFRDEY